MRDRGILWVLLCASLFPGFAACLTSGGGTARAETAEPKGLDFLARASKDYDGGHYAESQADIEQAFKAGLSNELSARAILLRGQIEEKTGQLARALSDYSAAQWMAALPNADRKKAEAGKDRVMAALKLGGGSPHGSAQQASASASSGSSSSSSGGISGFFNGLFGLSSESKPAPQPTPEPAPKPSEAAPPPPAAPSPAAPPRAAPRKVADAAPKPRPAKQAAAAKRAAEARPAPKAAPAAAVLVSEPVPGGFHIDFGTVEGEAAGRSQAQAIKTKLAGILVNRELLLEPNARKPGSLRILVGPYKTKTIASALCAEMQQRGVPCRVTE